MKILHYCQHVLGIGHFFRSLEICKAFSGHDVILVTGGSPVPVPLPSHIRTVHLPGLMMDQNFSGLFPTDEGRTVDQVMEERKNRLFQLFAAEAPDIFLVELYPFGRKAFRFEIDPILKGIRSGDLPPARVICSLRDVLVEKNDPEAYEERVVDLLNRYFDAVLIHADPRVLRLDETFSRVSDIALPLVYTGFVTPKPASDAGMQRRQQLGIGQEDIFVVASAGNGSVGSSLLHATANSFALMDRNRQRQLYVFTGPGASKDDFNRLERLSNKDVRVFRFTHDFLSYLAAADLSVSMAGYNTCMNIAAAGVPALVWPFSQNREQSFRAERLAQRGILRVLNDGELAAGRLAAIMQHVISQRRRPAADINLGGAEYTAAWLTEYLLTAKGR